MAKKWCEYCRININYDKKSIQDHEATRKHQQNKQRHIKFQRIKIQKAQKQAKEAAKDNLLLSTANIPKAKKGSKLEAEVNQYRNQVMNEGKMAIHQLIAEKTQGLYGAPIEYPQKQDLVLAENYQQQEENQNEQEVFEMWKIDICEETGKPCLINRITQKKVYEVPVGYVLSEEQREEWEDTKQFCEQMEKQKQEGNQMGLIGEWEEVSENEDYFQMNKAQNSESQLEVKQNTVKVEQINNSKKDKEKNIQYKSKVKLEEQNLRKDETLKIEGQSWIEKLEEKVQRQEIDGSQVFREMMENKFRQSGSVKDKNQTLKKLIKNGIEIFKAVPDQDLDLVKDTKITGFKPRKKVKKCTLISDNDII